MSLPQARANATLLYLLYNSSTSNVILSRSFKFEFNFPLFQNGDIHRVGKLLILKNYKFLACKLHDCTRFYQNCLKYAPLLPKFRVTYF